MEQENDAQGQFLLLPLTELHAFRHHPFHVRDDEKMQEMVESIRTVNVLIPGIARPRPEGGYEIISGHRRKRACELAGLKAMPFIVRNLDDDEATIILVDANLQRENILPSERAFALKMKLEALKRQGERTDLTSRQLGEKLSVTKVADKMGSSDRQIHRIIRLTNLEPSLLQMVDDRKLAFNPAVELSFLSPEEQRKVVEGIAEHQTSPSLAQAQRMKKASQEGALTEEMLHSILSEPKKPEQRKSYLNRPAIRKYFPKACTLDQIEKVILRLLEAWWLKRQKKREQAR